jgi:hypothetical protein
MRPPSQYRFNDWVDRLINFVAKPVKVNDAGATFSSGEPEMDTAFDTDPGL